MYKELKEEILEIIDITSKCPDNLKEKCFEILLNNLLISDQSNNTKTQLKSINEIDVVHPAETSEAGGNSNQEVSVSSFHIKIQRLLTSSGINDDILNELYYIENEKLMPLYDSMNSLKMSECQLRLCILTAFENSYNNGNGELSFNGEIVRKRCQEMKCYDSPNFATIMKNGSKYFDNWNGKYEKSTEYTLSSEGKKHLPEILVSLSQA